MPANEQVGVANGFVSAPICGMRVDLIHIPPAPAEAALALGDGV